MTRFNIPPIDPPEFDPVRVNPIEKDKKIKEDFPEREGQNREKRDSLISYALLSLFSKSLNKMLPRHDREGEDATFGDKLDLTKHLSEVKDLLALLKERDESANSHYAQRLTECWNLLLNDLELLRSALSPVSELRKAVKTMVHEVDSYPPTEDHSLGFYLTHYAGEQWLPFPFMAILRRLHQNHKEKGKASDLTHLIERIEDALDLLIPKFPIDE